MENIAKNEIEQYCVEMAVILGLSEPVSEKVLQAALFDSTYAHHLLVCRGEPEFLSHLLANPPRIDESSGSEKFTAKALPAMAEESLALWAKTGFSTVSDETYYKRLKSCEGCPELKIPPENKKSLTVSGVEKRKPSICGKCGCVVEIKARKISDTCPDPHPFKQGFNRWDEPLAPMNGE